MQVDNNYLELYKSAISEFNFEQFNYLIENEKATFIPISESTNISLGASKWPEHYRDADSLLYRLIKPLINEITKNLLQLNNDQRKIYLETIQYFLNDVFEYVEKERLSNRHAFRFHATVIELYRFVQHMINALPEASNVKKTNINKKEAEEKEVMNLENQFCDSGEYYKILNILNSNDYINKEELTWKNFDKGWKSFIRAMLWVLKQRGYLKRRDYTGEERIEIIFNTFGIKIDINSFKRDNQLDKKYTSPFEKIIPFRKKA